MLQMHFYNYQSLAVVSSPSLCLFDVKHKELYTPPVLNLLRLEDHLQILSLGRGPPLIIVPWKIAKIGLFVCL